MQKRHFNTDQQPAKTMKGARLRSYAYALLCKREYSKAELRAKLNQYAEDPDEVERLLEEFSQYQYQSDQRVAEQVLVSQIRKGKGPRRILQTLQQKQVDQDYIQEQVQETDWLEHAYQLKVKKYGTAVEKDPKLQAKQIRFLQYRGYDMDVILKAVRRSVQEE
ncbi:regulatory protein RecX [Acinetobacter sp. MB5]|uniref:regulatory protein RecX n=1 Tax=Acinetobacter sp. MB5 TaxID=2069438 RepID=UPI000DCF9DCE|nr:regulatory protein RecX [Acinetobacter sp. MB5]